MSSIPAWLLGRHTTTVDAQFMTADSAGALSLGGSAQHLVGLVDEVRYSAHVTTQEVNALNSTRQNHVPVENDPSFELVEIMRSSVGLNLLAALWANASSGDYVTLNLTRGGNSYVFVGMMDSYSEQIAKGRSTARMVIKHVDIGGPNPTYA